MIHRDAAIGVFQSKNQVTELEGPGGIAVDEHDRLAPALVDVMHGLAVLGFKPAAPKREHFVRDPVRTLGGGVTIQGESLVPR